MADESEKPKGKPFHAIAGGVLADADGRHLTVNHVASLLHRAYGDRPKSYYARQIRGWAQNRLMDHVDRVGRGRTAGRLFDSDGPYRARLLSFLTTLGMSPHQMRPFVALLDAIEGETPPLERVRAGERVYLSVMLDDSGDPLSGRVTAVSDPYVNTAEATDGPSALVIDLQELFAPLVSLEQAELRSEDQTDSRST